MIYTYYDKIHTVPGIGRAPLGLPGPRALPAWYQALPEQAQKGLLVGSTALCGCDYFFSSDCPPGQSF
jgi:hypothetical protein